MAAAAAANQAPLAALGAEAAAAAGAMAEAHGQPMLVQGTLSSPRLPRTLSIRSKLLYTAIQEDDYETVVRLVQAKIREHEENYLGQQEHRFAEEPPAQDMPFLILATLKGNVRVMKFLLENLVESVNVCDAHHGNTPLHYAVMMGGKGHTGRNTGPLAVIKSRKRGRLTGAALVRACWAPLRRRRASSLEEQELRALAKDLIGFLLGHGADPLLRNHKGITPLMEMARYHVPPPPRSPVSPLLRLLPLGFSFHLVHDAAPTSTSLTTGLTTSPPPPQDLAHPVLAWMRQLLLTHAGARAAVDARDAFGRTALFVAADSLNAEGVRVLLEVAGADPTVANNRGVRPMDLLKGRGRAHLRILPTYWPVLRMLENALAEPDRRRLLRKARALGDEGYAVAFVAGAAMAKGTAEGEALGAARAAAPAFLRQRLPAPPFASIPASDDSSRSGRKAAPLPSVEVRWDRLQEQLPTALSDAGARKTSSSNSNSSSNTSSSNSKEVAAAAAALETQLGVFQQVVHGGALAEVHFHEVLELLRAPWDEDEEGQEQERA